MGTSWVSALYLMVCVAGLAPWVSLKARLPQPHSSPGSAHIQVRTSLPSESTQNPVRPHWCLEKQRPERWETVVCQKQKPNYTKGKRGRAREIKTARKGFAFNTHTVLLSFSQEMILSSRTQCQMFAQSVCRGLRSPRNSKQLNLNSALLAMGTIGDALPSGVHGHIYPRR